MTGPLLFTGGWLWGTSGAFTGDGLSRSGDAACDTMPVGAGTGFGVRT